MKRYLLAMVALTLLVVSPFAYQQWAEAKRLDSLAELRDAARELDAVSPDEAIRLARGDSAVVILYTGDTRGHLEPCGCYSGQSGGIPRRNAVIAQFRDEGIDPLIVDAGGLADGDAALDILSTETYVRAMGEAGYHAIALTDEDRRLAGDSIGDDGRFLVADGAAAPDTRTTARIADRHVAIFAIDSQLEGQLTQSLASLDDAVGAAEATADLTVVLVDGPVDAVAEWARGRDDVDALISSAPGIDRREGDLVVLHASPKGETLGKASLSLASSHDVTEYFATEIALREDVHDHDATRALLTEFYEQVASDPTYHVAAKRLFEDQAEEQDPGAVYAGPETCKTCHDAEYDQWTVTPHAVAYNTLQTVQRHFHPDCVSCHVTGFGYEEGYRIGDTEYLQGVGCETCHGPGQAHADNPQRANIRREVPDALCAQCHNEEHSPGFADSVHLVRKEVDHSEKVAPLEGILQRRMRGALRTEVELFVMSMCPAGVGAEDFLLPLVKEYRDDIDFRLHYFGKEDDENAEAGTDFKGFSSMHGRPEVMEDVRQLVVAREYPDRYIDFILCRNKSLTKSWEDCARKLGLDVARIAAGVDSDEMVAVYRDNTARTHALEVSGSPTLYIDGRKHPVWVFRNKVKGQCR